MYISKAFYFLAAAFIAMQASAQPVAQYLSVDPIVDGYADKDLPYFRFNSFDSIVHSKESNPNTNAGYYLAYNAKYLYLYIEAEADSITLRDRGYQNGDGFHLIVGKPQPNSAPTDEFYVLGFSAQNSWSHKTRWYYNIDLSFKMLGDDVQFETGSRNGKISFELLLPWSAVYPYNPLFYDEIGLNLCFVKAIGEKDKSYYYIKYDRKSQNEQSRREYVSFAFEKPNSIAISNPALAVASMLAKNTITEDEYLTVDIATSTAPADASIITVRVYSGEGTQVALTERIVQETTTSIAVDGKLSVGGYKVLTYCNSTPIGEHYLTVLPKANISSLKQRLQQLKPSITAGGYNTVMFYISDVEASLSKLKSYENSYYVRQAVSDIAQYITGFENGIDLVAQQTGTYRRAYPLNGRLYPYSVFVPDSYDSSKQYPLLVFLHGSGQDDRALANTPKPNDFIVLAPNGRNVSNCYATEEAQVDIEASISDVIQNFNIDSSKIILSGFSMGGYGVYRTYYQHPERYSALAIHSGHPNLAQRMVSSTELNFLEAKNLKIFKNVPIYIFHGKQDLNCPYNITEEFVKLLKKNGSNIFFQVGDEGHESMNQEALNRYYRWLREHVE